MADTSEADGVENRVSDHDSFTVASDADFHDSQHAGQPHSDTSIATSLSKRIKMDGDGDGAPSSSEASPRHHNGENDNERGEAGRESAISFDSSAESTPRRSAAKGKASSTPSTPQTSCYGQDLSAIDMKTSWDGSVGGGSSKAVRRKRRKKMTGMLADPVKIAKEREKEERVRQARERLMEERRKKLEELKEQQRIAQENREKQLEMRRKKIEDLRKRDHERRAAVEERRKKKEEVEKARRESILQKAEERVARYEAWKAGGRKGMFSGGEGGTPKHLSMSTSVLYNKSMRDFSSTNALSHSSRPESSMALNTIREGRRSFIGTSSMPAAAAPATHPSGHHHHYQRPTVTSGMTASMPSPVRMRDNKGPRKQRPASVASSMPSFVGGEPAKSPRSKSTDRTGRDRSKTRTPRREDKAMKNKENLSEKASKAETDVDNDGDKDKTDGGERKEKKSRASLSFFDRLSTPKYSKKDTDLSPRDTPPKRDAPVVRVQFADEGDQDGMVEQELSPRKAYSTTNLATMRKRSSMRERPTPPAKDITPKHTPSKDTSRGATSATKSSIHAVPTSAARSASPARKGGDKSGSSTPRVTPPPSSSSTPTHTPAAAPVAPVSAGPPPPQQVAPASADDGTTASRSATGPSQDITAEEYKARLAEKRRQAREKAEKEAEEERKRQEEERLAEEERQRKEEEEQRRQEEEAIRLASEARKAEEERLQRAIEAEEKRRKEEAERLEQERKAKEEADRKAKEEAERLEREKQEKSKREEEERLQRKKKLEMIMKRVKPSDSSADTSAKAESLPKSVSSSPSLSQVNSSQTTPEEQEKSVTSGENSGSEDASPAPPEGSVVDLGSEAMTMSFYPDSEESSMTTSYTETSSSSTVTVGRSASSGDIVDAPSSSQDEAPEAETAKTEPNSAATTPSKVEDKTSFSEPSSETKSKFKSPLLQQLVENKGGDSSSGGPKFKSPLLQNLLGKTKVGARMGLSASMGDLSQNKESSVPSTTTNSSMATSVTTAESSKEIFKQGKDDEDKDEDTSLHESKARSQSFQAQHTVTNGIPKDSGDSTFSMEASKSSSDSSPLEANSRKLPVSMMSDSALGSSIEPHGDGESAPGMMSQSIIFNGHGDHKGHGLEDSSISLHSIEENVPNTASVIPFETVPEGNGDRTEPSEDNGQFEELIDLKDTSGKTNSIVGGTPIIAFEENNRRPDVTESLS